MCVHIHIYIYISTHPHLAHRMVLGAYHGASGIPKYLRDSLNAWKESEEMLSRLPLLAGTKDGKRAEEL